MATRSASSVFIPKRSKSTFDFGLDQEFNSLDAQYEAASAYIKSQAHAGWTLIRSRYDDGGYSGGSTDRPDLQKLLDDIRARKIDVIVVYKVDRLTRSLALREIKKRIRPLFTQERVATNAGLFLEGLLGDEQRKTGWMRAEAAGDPGPWRQQAILGRGDWDADALRDIVRDYVVEHLADDDAVLVIDETGFLKQGKASCGVARQYTGSAGKITNARSESSLPTFRVMVMR